MYCIVVKRGAFQSYDRLHVAFGQQLPIIWDRRHGERRRAMGSLEIPNRRSRARRGDPPASWPALGFAVAERY
jgi:hypothetical protein